MPRVSGRQFVFIRTERVLTVRAGALRGHELVDAVHGLRYVESMIHALELWGLGVRGLVGCRQLILLYAGGERVG